MNDKTLARELATFKRELPRLMPAEEGKFALVIGDTLIGTYEAYGDALKIGYAKAGLDPFLVKKISGAETVAYFTRDLSLECRA